MREFSSELTAALGQDYVEYFFLIDLYLNSTYHLSTYPSDVTVGSVNYISNGTIFSYDPPRQNTVVDREAYKISLIDPNNSLLAEARAGIVGKDVTIRAGFVGPNGPLLAEEDLVYVYKGFVDAPSISNDFETKIMNIECSSPMADLDIVRPFFTTKYGIEQFDTTDTCFDRVNDGYNLQVKWGKI